MKVKTIHKFPHTVHVPTSIISLWNWLLCLEKKEKDLIEIKSESCVQSYWGTGTSLAKGAWLTIDTFSV